MNARNPLVRWLPGAFVTLLLVLATAGPSDAQTVRGRVVGEAGVVPVGGAVVTLLDSAGTRLRAVLTSREGTFLVPEVAAGTYQVRVEMIGRENIESEPFDVGSDDPFLTLSLPTEPIRLAGLRVTAVGRCAMGSELEPETALVWEEAQKALRAALITQEESLYRFEVLRTHRILDLSTGEEVDQHVVSDVREARSPFRSLPPEDIARDGYTRVSRGRTLLYGPNTNVLLSSGFLAAHCFGLQQEADRPGQIGLTFEPAQGHDVPEIGGVLWLDEASAELRTLEFRYRNLPRYLGSGGYSGFAEFQRLEAGHWIIRHWWLRTPGVQEEAEVVRVERIR